MLAAAQHIYTNVEPDLSPRNHGGFQTLVATYSALTEADIQAIEQRVSYVLPAGSDATPVKRIAFPLFENRIAIGQVIPLTERDASGRGGRSLAHTLVFDANAFAETGGDPFAVFDTDPFYHSVKAALADADFDTAALPIRELDVRADEAAMRRAMRRVPVPARRALVALALAGSDAPTLAFVGSPEAAEPLLRAALLPLTPAERVRFSFDTYFYRGRLAHTPYRAVGLPDAPRGSRFHVLHLDRLSTVSAPIVADATPFAVWAGARLADSDADLDAFMHDSEDARAASDFLLNRAPLPAVTPVSTEVATGVPDLVRSRLKALFAEHSPSVLARRAATFSMATNSPSRPIQMLSDGLTEPEIRRLLYRSYEAEHFAAPAAEELTALTEHYIKTPSDPLAPWAAWWASEAEIMPDILAVQSADAYRTFVQRALAQSRPGSPLVLLQPDHTALFVEALSLLPEDRRPTLRTVARHLVEHGAASALDALTPHLDALSPKALRRLSQDTEALASDQAPQFTARLATLVEALPSNHLGARLRRLIGLPPKGNQ